MIYVNKEISIGDNEVKFDFIRASGPGGQNVNKVASAVKLRFDIKNSPSLPDGVRSRLMTLAGKRLTEDGILIIDARRFRTQAQNRKDAVDRLMDLIKKAAKRPKNRLRTKQSKASKIRVLQAKRHKSRIKKMRKSVRDFDE